MDNSVGLLFVVLVIGFFLILATVSVLNDKKRTEALAALALGWGFQFDPKPQNFFLSFKGLALFSKGHGRRTVNLMVGDGPNAGLYVFDYRYKTGHGRQTRHYAHTVVGFDLGDQKLPSFAIQPRTFWKSLGSKLRGGEIKFPDLPGLSARYHISGDREPAIRALVGDPLVREIGDEAHLCLEGNDRWLIVYRNTKRVPPEQIPDAILQAVRFRDILRAGVATA